MSDTHPTDDKSGEPIVHEYDDIQEADNQLPRWWLYTLFGSIVFAGGYWLYFHTYGTGKTPLQVFEIDRMEAAKAEQARLEAAGPFTPDKLVAMSKNLAVVEAGRAQFASTCATCHAANATGQVGPNLTDEYWIHGGKPENILRSIRGGWVDKGMPAWGPQIGEAKVREVAAYVYSLKGKNLTGKAPQGEKE